jgi:outer membrane protein OmpA-like peptidoglycan-associated protein
MQPPGARHDAPPAKQGQMPRGAPAPDKDGHRHSAPSTATPGQRQIPGKPGFDRSGPGGPRPSFATKGHGPRRIDDVKKQRVESVSKSGARIIREPGNRTIVHQNNRTIITHNEGAVFNRFTPNAKRNKRRDGGTESVVERPGGVRVHSEFDKDGRLLRRYRRDRSGKEFVYVDNRRFYRNLAVGIGVGALATAAVVALAPPAHSLPRDKYIVEYVDASDDDLYETLTAPPVERLDRGYSLEEIRYSHSLRERMRRVDLDNVNFDTGSFDVAPDEYEKLARIAHALKRVIDRDPTEVFLIEGHTDAIGSDEDNLSLSDHRAESVAQILVEHFEIPIENLTTQGYGEQYLKVDTQEPERANRRVSLRRITPLLSRNDQ